MHYFKRRCATHQGDDVEAEGNIAHLLLAHIGSWSQGGGVTYLEPSASQIGHTESIKDTARVLGRMYDGIEYRGFGQDVVEELAKYAGVPVFNGLTNEFHPTQMLADALTMREHSGKPLNQTAFAYVGDARYNMANSLLVLGAKLGMDVRIGAPKTLWPSEKKTIGVIWWQTGRIKVSCLPVGQSYSAPRGLACNGAASSRRMVVPSGA